MKSCSMKVLFYLVPFMLLTSCTSDSENEMSCTGDYDQKVLLAHMADQLIIPSVQSFEAQAQEMNQAISSFVNTTDETTLEQAQNSFKEAYIQYQRLAQFNFGPADQLNFRERVNNFPVNENQLVTSIENEDYDFSLSMQYDQGFPALDYLLFGQGSQGETVDRYVNEEKLQTYTEAVSEDIANTASLLSTQWQEYREEFIDRTGTAAGASLAQMVNSWNEEYEITKRDRLGIPSGQVTLGFANPTKVEAYYSGLSIALLHSSLQAAQKVFVGESLEQGTDGPGLADLLDHVGAEKEGRALSEIILSQYQIIDEKLLALPNSRLSDLVDSEKQAVEELYIEASRQVLYKKTDLPSMLCIAITYVDNPSDSD